MIRKNNKIRISALKYVDVLCKSYGLLILNSILILMLSGCHNQDVEDKLVANNQEIQLQIDSAEASFENGSSEQAKSLTYRFEGDNVFPRIHLKEGDEVRGFCFVRNTNRNIPITKTTVSWRVSGTGLKSGPVTVNLSVPQGQTPGAWQICCFVGNGSYNETDGSITFRSEEKLKPIASGEEQSLLLPYLSSWLTLEQKSDGRIQAPKVRLRPQGAFVRLKITNETGQDISLNAVRLVGTDATINAAPFVWKGKCFFNNNGNEPTVHAVLNMEKEIECPLSAPLNLKAGQTSGWYGFWCMPGGAKAAYSSNIQIKPSSRNVEAQAPWWLYRTPLDGRSDSEGKTSGKSYRFSLRLRKLTDTKLNNWMQDIEDNRLVCKMSIPGTHDTGAYTGNAWVKTQDKNIEQQLNSGIRFFDIRLVHQNGVLKLCHGSHIFDTTFVGDVLKTTAEFLKEHPSETVIMTIKRDHDLDKDVGTKYRGALQKALEGDRALTPYMVKSFRSDFTLGDLRGKMLIISRDGWIMTPSGNIPRWSDNASFTSSIESTNGSSTTIHVEDHYKSRASDKVSYVAQNVRKAQAAFSGSQNDWFITFSSSAGPNGGAWPWSTTRDIDPHVNNILRGDENFRTSGILVFNFAGWWDDMLTKTVIELNHTKP